MNNHQSPQSIKIPFGEFPRLKCKECSGEMIKSANLFLWWRVPSLLKHKFGNSEHICVELYKCAECGNIPDGGINTPGIPPGTSTEDLVIVSCNEPSCQCREFTPLCIIYNVPLTYRPVLQKSRIRVEYMLCAHCGTFAKEINMYPLPEGVKWEPKHE